jgi:hypothetical protein
LRGPAASTTVTVSAAAGQYSDRVDAPGLTAATLPNVANGPTGTMEFFVNGTSVGTAAVAGTGNVAKEYTIDLPAAGHTITAQFTSTNPNFASSALSAPAALAVTAEAATVTYVATNVTAVQAPAGATLATLSLVATVAETQPDVTDPAGGTAQAGLIARAPLTMQLVPVGPGSAVAGACTAGAPAGTYGAMTYTCTFASVPVNTYAVQTVGRYRVGCPVLRGLRRGRVHRVRSEPRLRSGGGASPGRSPASARRSGSR